jgi:hypothetical protein
LFFLASVALAQFSFHLIDNFEMGRFDRSRWWRFGALEVKVTENPSREGRDLIAESCGEYALNLSGVSKEWYIGGIGTDLDVDASQFSRFQMDIYGSWEDRGKVIIELFDDDNQNFTIEQDAKKNYETVHDDKWVTEVNILGEGFTRVSIPFSAFRDVNPEVGDNIWNPDRKNGSGGLLKMQVVAISEKKNGKASFKIDNLLLTF